MAHQPVPPVARSRVTAAWLVLTIAIGSLIGPAALVLGGLFPPDPNRYRARNEPGKSKCSCVPRRSITTTATSVSQP